ncbi:MAG: hypoxanthine phosphoribosyltransferase [Deltaproteobacteria bacterium]|nr:hypoxanthine phosphoribosyltransferase [Deltaproteobacteria bacterium]
MQTNLKQLFPPEEIHIMVNRLAGEIRRDFPSKNPVLVGALKGAFIFLADLARAVKMPLEVDFIQTASYGKQHTPSSEVAVTRDLTLDIRERHVIIVEGIIDRGTTARAIKKRLEASSPASMSLCALLARDGHAKDVQVDYVGARIGEGFVVGYGMDYHEHYRALPGLYTVAA